MTACLKVARRTNRLHMSGTRGTSDLCAPSSPASLNKSGTISRVRRKQPWNVADLAIDYPAGHFRLTLDSHDRVPSAAWRACR